MRSCLTIAAIALASFDPRANAQSAAFTYQGLLESSGQPYDGNANLVFRLFDVPSGGSALGTQTLGPVHVADGLFNVQLNASDQFGPSAFDGSARWLEVEINGTALSPRQPITATPYARFAAQADRLDGLDASAFLQAVPLPLTLSGISSTHVFRAENASSTSGSASIACFATATSGNIFAAYIESASNQGYGLFSRSTSPTGFTIGVGGWSDSPDGSGGFFRTTSNTGTGEAVSAQCFSADGKGIWAQVGSVFSNVGAGYGVEGESFCDAGTGVYGYAHQASGINFGVRGKTDSPNGYAAYFEGRSYFNDNVGIGTLSPSNAQLVVASAVGNTNAQFGGATGPLFAISNTPTVGFNLLFNGTWKYGGNGFGGALGMAQNDGHLYYLTAPSGTAGNNATVTSRVTDLSTGEVGIGTGSPTAKLHIGGTPGTDGVKFPDGSLQVRATRMLRGNTGSLDAPALGAGVSVLVTFGFPGVTVGSAVIVAPTSDYGNGLVIGQAFVPSAGTIQFRVQNVTASTIDPAPMVFAIAIFE
jgi:hypothetical protein